MARRYYNANIKLVFTLALCAASGLMVAGCPQNQGASAPASSGGGTSGSTSASKTPTGTSGSSGKTPLSFTIVSAVPEASGASGSGDAPNFTLNFNAISLDSRITDVCQVQDQNGGNFDPAKTCKCSYVWRESNLSDPSAIDRTVLTAPTQITSFEVKCPAPDIYDIEIADNTPIKISLIPDTSAGNVSGFSTNVLTFVKKPVTSTGDFRDSEGRAYRNIIHYVCHDKFQKNLVIDHTIKTAPTNPRTERAVSVPLANDFTMSSGAAVGSYSAQSYYYDFYVRSNEVGSIKRFSGLWSCPEANINGLPSYFPFDSQFALSLQRTADFSVPVGARTTIDSAQLGADVIGYAAKPNADGTCPSFTDSTGRIRRTFRLRQYSSLYPVRYDANGEPKDESQPMNTVLILDRPVDKLTQDPLRPLTRLGPKPCPFSFKTAQFGQKCMTDASLAGWNIDGTQIQSNPKCPIYPPIPVDDSTKEFYKDDGTLVIRPFRPFLPHYLENKSFRACAFQSSNMRDAEIVLSHDRNIFPGSKGPSDFYCAKHYPHAGNILNPGGGNNSDKPPGDCDTATTAAAIKTSKNYACLRAYDTTNSGLATPSAGCCQICSGPDCTSVGGGATATGRNAVFSPPRDMVGTTNVNPPQAVKLLPRANPSDANSGGCFDPYED